MTIDTPVREGQNGPARTAVPWVVRRGGAGEAAAFALVGSATFLETYAGWLPGADVVAHSRRAHGELAYAELLAQAGTQAWLGEALGAPVGYLVLSTPEFPPSLVQQGDVELKRVYVLSRFHGTGLGEALLRAATDSAREDGARRMLVGLHQENARALAFYRRHRFVEIGRRQFQMGSIPYDDPVMARAL